MMHLSLVTQLITFEQKYAHFSSSVLWDMRQEHCVICEIGPSTKVHYNDVIMSAMASQITSPTIVYSAVFFFRRRWKKTSKLRVTGLCAGNSSMTCEFPTQMVSNAETGSIGWHHHAIDGMAGSVLPSSHFGNSWGHFLRQSLKFWCIFVPYMLFNINFGLQYPENSLLNDFNTFRGLKFFLFNYFSFGICINSWNNVLSPLVYLYYSLHPMLLQISWLGKMWLWRQQGLFATQVRPRCVTGSAFLQQISILLTHWGRDKMADVFQTTFSNGFSYMKIYEFRLIFLFIPRGPFNNIPALIQIMAWRRPGGKPLSEQWWIVYWRIYAPLRRNEFNTSRSTRH